MKIIKIVQNILIVLVLVILPLIFFILITSKWPIILGIRSYTVLTGSMQPSIPIGAIVFTKPTDYKIGDIISFQRNSIVVTHRVVNVLEKQNNKISYRTKGDANDSKDSELVSNSLVVGKVMFTLPFLGRFISYLKTVPGFIIFIVLPTIIFVGFELYEIKKEFEKQIEKKLLKKLQGNI
ncbi:MAG: signal peptidase I [Patescibacteria group bacterium]|nr:signal peptidase I [Patescibacteria group bacterium]